MDAIRKIEHSDSEAMGFAIMEHLGPLALTHGHISPIDAFELGWKARAQTLASKEAEQERLKGENQRLLDGLKQIGERAFQVLEDAAAYERNLLAALTQPTE